MAFSSLDLEGCIDSKSMNHKPKNKEFEIKPIVALDLIFLELYLSLIMGSWVI